MSDLILEIFRAITVGLIFIYLFFKGKKQGIFRNKGWYYILGGFSFILFGTLLDITDNFPTLNKYIIIGDTKAEAFLEKVVGYLIGFIMLAIGFLKWIPTVSTLKNTEEELRIANDELELKVKERKQAEETLVNAAQQWRTTFDSITDMVSLLDAEGKILRCNKTMKNFIGKPFHEILNRSCWEVMLGSTTPIENCPFLRMKETLRRETLEISVNDRWFDIVIDPILNETGIVTGAVNTISDITEQKHIEEAIRSSEEKYRNILDNIEEGYYEVDIAGNFTFTNDPEAQILGYFKDELIGMNNRQYTDKEEFKKMGLRVRVWVNDEHSAV